MKEFLKEVEEKEIGKIVQDVFLSKYTTYKVGGLASVIIYPKNQEKLVSLCKLIQKHRLKYKILGYADLATSFNDDRKLKKERDIER